MVWYIWVLISGLPLKKVTSIHRPIHLLHDRKLIRRLSKCIITVVDWINVEQCKRLPLSLNSKLFTLNKLGHCPWTILLKQHFVMLAVYDAHNSHPSRFIPVLFELVCHLSRVSFLVNIDITRYQSSATIIFLECSYNRSPDSSKTVKVRSIKIWILYVYGFCWSVWVLLIHCSD